MGRGRAKAKQQKVARELKYNTQFTDLDALQRELGVPDSGRTPSDHDADEDAAEFDDDYARWANDER